MISYQTANFGARAKHIEETEDDLNQSSDKKKGVKKLNRDNSVDEPEKMFASMSDLNFVQPTQVQQKPSLIPTSKAKENEIQDQLSLTWKKPLPLPIGPKAMKQIISAEQREQMRDISNNWKVRTATIDDIHISIQATIEQDPDLIMREAENLLEFFVGLLSD